MAQYGKSFYGASYYGAYGTYIGQFESDITSFRRPITAGSLVFTAGVKLNNLTYPYSDTDVFRFNETGQWVDSGVSMVSNDDTPVVKITLTGSYVTLNFTVRGADGATLLILQRKLHSSSAPVETIHTVDTKTTGTLQLDNPYGQYEFVIEKDPVSAAGSYVEIESIQAVTDDISVEFRSREGLIPAVAYEDGDVEPSYSEVGHIEDNHYLAPAGYIVGNWTQWEVLSLAKVYDGASDTYIFEGTTSDIAGALEYQFMLYLATSDTDTSPEVTYLQVQSSQADGYSTSGYWKTLIDLGSSVEDITSVTINVDEPEDTKARVYTRTTDDTAAETQEDAEISWGYWSVPYSLDTDRAVIDIKTTPALTEAYVITPLIVPANIKNWRSFGGGILVNDRDPVTERRNNNMSLLVQFLDADLNVIQSPSDSWADSHELGYYDNEEYEVFACTDEAVEISKITEPIRIKTIFRRRLGYSTPAVDNIQLFSDSEYEEFRYFGPDGVAAYGSAVFNNNTGTDDVYMDGLARTNLASIENMAFSLPWRDTPTGPRQVLDIDYTIQDFVAPQDVSESLKVYWDTNKETISNSHLDHLKVEVEADQVRVKKHIHYGSGITAKIENPEWTNYDSHSISNIFYPPLARTKEYAYFLQPGFSQDLDEPNLNVDIRWNSENFTEEINRRNLMYTPGGQVNVSIVSTTEGGLVNWRSEEVILDGLVNEGSGSSPRPRTIVLSSDMGIPEITAEAIVGELPFQAEVVNESVVSEGETVADKRINLSIDHNLNKYKEVSMEKVLFYRGSTDKDILPRARTKQVLGIYTNPNQFSPMYVEDIHFVIEKQAGTDWGNQIDWSLSINDGGLTTPTDGDELYISLVYYELVEMTVRAQCDFNRNSYDYANIYRTSPLSFTGECSFASDYVSEEINVETLWPALPSTVDTTTLELQVLPTENPNVRLYMDENKVVGTLAGFNPKENWHPYIREGNYYIGKDAFYLYTSPWTFLLDGSTIPQGENIEYVPFGQIEGVIIQEGTENLLENTSFRLKSNEVQTIFSESFER